jgi:hypothetical protein
MCAIEAFGSGCRSLKIVAGAGTGKTSTLAMLANSTRRRGVYLAFNRAMADDAARRMPANIIVRTAHALAMGHVDRRYKLKIAQRLSGRMVCDALDLDGDIRIGADTFRAIGLAYVLLDWVRRFCASADAELGRDTAPVGRMLELLRIDPDTATGADYRLARATLDELLPLARRLWQHMSDPADDFPATHDVYLKVWALSGPRIAADFILFDEAQDANPAMLEIVRRQSAQQVYVGDPAQQIYAWRGAVNAMDAIAADREVTLTESFRFGPGIASFANHALDLCGSRLRLKGRASAERAITDPKPAVLCRTNAGVIDVALSSDLDLSEIHVIGGTGPLRMLLVGIRDLRDRDATTVAELAHFRSFRELIEHAKEAQDELAMLLRLTDDGARCDALISALDQMADQPERAKLVIATTHKAKGLEWSDVTLHRDFRGPESSRWTQEEANLIYVAGTRAMRTLTLTDPAAVGAPQSVYHSHGPLPENSHVHAT